MLFEFVRRLACSAVTLSLVAAAAAAAPARAAEPGNYPPVPPAKDPSRLGQNIQRTMTLLATSTPQRRNKVRVLFYGQSITEQAWSKLVADDLRKRFPHADLEIENRAIGGFASQLLIRPAEHDLYPFYPDLVIFHVYGGHGEYEQIIKNVRSRTTAEVLMQLDHVAAGGARETPAKWPPDAAEQAADKGLWWDSVMNSHLLPEIAKKYGCGLADVRGGWVAYLKANNLQPQALLKDGVHLNAHGDFVMAELVKQNLVYRPELPNDAWKDLVRTVEVGKGADWKDGKLRIEFEGNRVDAIVPPGASATGGKVTVLIDGKKPSELPGTYRVTRPAPGPWSPLFVSRVDHEKPLVIEDWTLKVTEVAADGKSFKYTVAGSVTGPDGAGDSGQTFVSKSGRVKLEPGSFFRGTNPPLPVGYESKWQVRPMFVDALQAPPAAGEGRERSVTLAQGLANGKHLLELVSEGGSPPALSAVRVYRPPVKME